MLTSGNKGMKRTLVVSEMTDVTSQRQCILDISMCKLQTLPLKKVEPSLRRSVLIFNTLKHIEQELHNEGVRIYSTCKPSIIPSIQTEECSLEVIPSLLNHNSKSCVCSHGRNTRTCDNVTSAGTCDNEHTLTSVGTHNAELMDTSCESYTSQYPTITAQCVSESYHDYANSNVQVNTSTSSTVEEVFGDLDLTMFDMDLLTVNSSPKLSTITGEDLDLLAPVMPINCKSDIFMEDFDSLLQQVFVTS